MMGKELNASRAWTECSQFQQKILPAHVSQAQAAIVFLNPDFTMNFADRLKQLRKILALHICQHCHRLPVQECHRTYQCFIIPIITVSVSLHYIIENVGNIVGRCRSVHSPDGLDLFPCRSGECQE
jgi:hypothetical protein